MGNRIHPSTELGTFLTEQLPEWKATLYKPKKNRVCRLQHLELSHTVTVRSRAALDFPGNYSKTPDQDFIYHAGEKRVIHAKWDNLSHLVNEIKKVHTEVLARLGTIRLIRGIITESVPDIPFETVHDTGWQSEPAMIEMHLPGVTLTASINNDGIDINLLPRIGRLLQVLDLANPMLIEQVSERIVSLLSAGSTNIIRTAQGNLAGNHKAIKSLNEQNEILETQLQWMKTNLYLP